MTSLPTKSTKHHRQPSILSFIRSDPPALVRARIGFLDHVFDQSGEVVEIRVDGLEVFWVSIWIGRSGRDGVGRGYGYDAQVRDDEGVVADFAFVGVECQWIIISKKIGCFGVVSEWIILASFTLGCAYRKRSRTYCRTRSLAALAADQTERAWSSLQLSQASVNSHRPSDMRLIVFKHCEICLDWSVGVGLAEINWLRRWSNTLNPSGEDVTPRSKKFGDGIRICQRLSSGALGLLNIAEQIGTRSLTPGMNEFLERIASTICLMPLL